MKNKLHFILIILLTVLITSVAYAEDISIGNNTSIIFGEAGYVEGLVLKGKKIMSSSKKGFYLLPATGKEVPDFFKGEFTVTKTGGKLNLQSKSKIKLIADVITKEEYLEIRGSIEKLTKGDKAVWLVFELPGLSKKWKIQDSLSRNSEQEPSYGNNIVPIIAGIADNGAIGMAIPPDSPCIFKTEGGDDKLAIKMAFGLTKDTVKFPNKAHFKIQIYGIDPAWGFRAVLEKYYNNYPEYYETTPRKIKLYNHHHDWLKLGDGDRGHLIDPKKKEHTIYFKTSCRLKNVENLKTIGNAINKLEEYINTHTYFHVQTEKETSENHPTVKIARKRVINSMNHNADGTAPVIFKEKYNEIDIPHNADPDLFKDKNIPTMGKWYMEFVKEKYDQGDIVIMHWDRFGGWGNELNYRRDHFAYLDYPVTFDTEGRLCIPTKFTYWKLMKRLREWGKKNNEFSQEVAGLKIYGTSKKFSQPAGFTKDGRFFTGAVVDAGWHEGSMKPLELGGMDEERMFIGRKSYRISSGNIVKQKKKMTLDKIKSALAQTSFYGFACPIQIQYFYPKGHKHYDKAYSHYTKPEHKRLWDKYLPALEAIRLAGWEPVTHAKPYQKGKSPAFGIERYGENGRNEIYLTVWGPDPPKSVFIILDYEKMGFAKIPKVQELISNTPVTKYKKGDDILLKFSMEKNMTRILKLTK